PAPWSPSAPPARGVRSAPPPAGAPSPLPAPPRTRDQAGPAPPRRTPRPSARPARIPSGAATRPTRSENPCTVPRRRACTVRRNAAGGAGGTGLRALRMLARRDLSVAALREALRRAGLAEGEVEAEVEAAGRLGALDDRRSASARARTLVLRGGWAREAMHSRLIHEGYAPGLAKEALAEAIRAEGWDARAVAARLILRGEPPRKSAR